MTKDGRHKRKVWADEPGTHPRRSGFACERCHKTWEYKGDELVPTYSEAGLVVVECPT
jgi:hypothetical protein